MPRDLPLVSSEPAVFFVYLDQECGHLKPGFHSHSFLSALIGLDACWGPELKAGAAHSPAAFTLQAKPKIAVTRTRSVLSFHLRVYKETFDSELPKRTTPLTALL
jgi:hypothetical protein